MSELQEHPSQAPEREGLTLVLPGPDELFVDIDDAESLTALAEGLKTLRENGEAVEVDKETVSRSGNKHVYVKLYGGLSGRQPDPILAVALQACLGSDRKRELLSILRIVREYKIPATCFFEKPEEAAS